MPTTGEPCRRRESRADDGRAVPTTGEPCRRRESRDDDGRAVPTTGEPCRRREKGAEVGRDVERSAWTWRLPDGHGVARMDMLFQDRPNEREGLPSSMRDCPEA